MINAVKTGKRLTYANASTAIASGAVVALGTVGIGIACADIAATTGVGELEVEGVFTLAKEADVAFAFGDRLWWNGTELTKTPGAYAIAGFCVAAAAEAATTAQVKLVHMGDTEPLNLSQAANVLALTGTLTGTTDGALVDIAAVSTAGGNTYADSAINTAITAINLQLKELHVKQTAVLTALKNARLMAADPA